MSSHGTMFTVAVSLIVSTAAIGIYDRVLARRGPSLATADVAGVYSAKQEEFTKAVTSAVDDAGRDKALADAKAFGVRLEQSLGALTQECNCLVVSRSAILGPTPDMIDLTGRLKEMVARND